MIKAQLAAAKKSAKSAAPEKSKDGAMQPHEVCINLHQTAETCQTLTFSGKLPLGESGPISNIGQTRYIPADVRREVFLRDEGRCTFVSKDGRRCDETVGLHLDHIRMFCRGGEGSLENLRLMCKNHNIYLAEENLRSGA